MKYLLLPFFMMPLFFSAQVALELEKGDKAFDNLALDEALYFFEVANEQQPNDPAITRRIANTYRRMGQMTTSAEWYWRTLELDSTNAQDMLSYAEALKSLGQYDEAINWYDRYYQRVPGDSRARSHLADRNYYLDLFADTLRYTMKKLAVNNADPVIGITAFTEGKFLMSAINANQLSLNDGKNEYLQYLDIYLVNISEDNELIDPVALGKTVNSKYHDGPVFFSRADNTLYITRNNIRNGRPVLDKKGTVNLKIYASEYRNGEFSDADELRFNQDDYSNGHPCITRDGQFMYFLSNRDGGFGGTDLYVSQKIGENWSEPINLGANVNTEGNEMFPYIAEDGLLYFASDGHAGLGGLDIFVSENTSGTWKKPTNLGAPVNSSSDDFAIVYDRAEDRGFFCSNRSGRGNDDIFYFTHKELDKTILAGTIRSDQKDVSLAGERVRIATLNTGMVTEQRLDEYEAFRVSADPGDVIEVYMLNAEYFDPEHPVAHFEVPNPITDPFMNMGEHTATLRRIPLHTGRLSAIQNAGLAESKSALADKLDQGDNPKAEGSPLLDDLKINRKPPIHDDSDLNIIEEEKPGVAQARKLEEEYTAHIQKGDNHFAREEFEQSIPQYEKALAVKPGDTYASAQVEKAEAAIEHREALKEAMAVTYDFKSTTSDFDLAALQIDNVLFDYNKSFVRDTDKAKLDQIVRLMKEHPETKLLIKAFCDSRGSLTYNESLSMSRAMAVQGYLIQKGIRKDRIQAEWFGEQRPLNDCGDGVPCTEEQYEINRRAEFKLVEVLKN